MRDNRVTVYYSDGEYLPTDKEITEWAESVLVGMVEWKDKSNDSEWLRTERREFNKHARLVINTLINHFDYFALAEFLAEECKDDLKDYFREAHEQELAENREATLEELERKEYSAAVAAGLRR